jgi:hypothetical protein
VKSKLAHDTCAVGKLEGCKAAFDHIFAVASEISTLPGSDDTIDDVTGASATWGLYSFNSADYKMLPDALMP